MKATVLNENCADYVATLANLLKSVAAMLAALEFN